MNNNKTKKNHIKDHRRCVTCYESKHKEQLIRVVRTAERKLIVDHTGKADGRGAYVCNNTVCISRALKENRFSRALKVSLDNDAKRDLEEEIMQGGLLDGDRN